MPSKYYAVRKGHKIGIYNNWEEAYKQVRVYSCAEYKGFYSLKQAKLYLEGYNLGLEDIKQDKDTMIAYISGSYSEKLNKYGSGVAICRPNGMVYEEWDNGENRTALLLKDIAGEIKAAIIAMREIKEMGVKKLIIVYNFEGISNLINKSRKAENETEKTYVNYYEENIKNYVDVDFKHIDNCFNDAMHGLAKYLAKYNAYRYC
ncbi:ribonuclease H family protein [Clostridioides difficile]|uniref:ribonuclease H family protein n=1 Tax=Clostridioides difficile TaxID=1496 RepID=UPI001A1FF41F|nr:ribonuclease H family protein [Clostridioides difficile]EGT3850356.1 reverse transcriptase-like protein [Clostridioides difficile]EKG0757311.1 ribonuclease H family protein [Clostridioides difficile]EKG0785782.1 ribonuclease H family protein [Clostridioides difficile]EKS6762645.1 ribonuclease H family protein [Clostridioides difficile]MBH6911424.1 ribonuclease H family protein [Clostridioides difficile]